MDLVNLQTGKPETVPDEQAEAAIRSGAYSFAQGQAVPVRDSAGRVTSMPAQQAMAGLASGDVEIASQKAADAQAKVERYGTVGQTALTAIEGAASTATLGASDWLERGLGGDEAAENARMRKETNPLARGLGEAAGFVPGLFTGGDEAEGAGLLAKGWDAIGAPQRVVGAIGDLAEHAAGALSPELGDSLLARIATKAVGTGARGTVEGAIYGGDQYLADQALEKNPDISGESLLAAVGHGALLGGAGGALLGAGGEIGKDVLGRIAPHIQGAAESQAFRALNPRKAFVTAAERIEGGAEGIGRELLDSGLIGIGDNVEQVADKVGAARQEAGAAVGKALETADAAGVEGPKLANVFQQLDEGPLARLKDLPSMNRGAIDRIESLKADLTAATGVKVPTAAEFAAQGFSEDVAKTVKDKLLADAKLTFKDAQKFRARIDDAIKWSTNPLAPVNETTEALKGVRRALEGEIEQAGDRASKDLGEDWLKNYKESKLRYRRLAVADDAAQDALDRRTANRAISPSDYGVGAAVGMGLGAPVGLLGAAAHHLIRERGNATAAVLLDKIGAFRGIGRAVGTIERETARGVGRAVGDEARVSVSTKERAFGGSFDKRREAVVEAAGNEEHAQAIQAAVGGIAQHAPGTAAAFSKAAARATAYLASQLPQPTDTTTATVSPKLAHYDPPASAKAAWNRKFDAVHDPVGTMAQIEKHTLTPDEVEAVSATHPTWYQGTVTEIKKCLLNADEPLSRARMQALSTWCNEPLTPTMQPSFIAAMQASHQANAPQARAPKTPKGNPSSNKSQERISDTVGLTGLSK
jgi:hypothetical protein